MKELFERARKGDKEAAIEIDIAVYLRTIEVALQQGWSLGTAGQGKEIFRHVARLALARCLPPALWSECRSCKPSCRRAGCKACGGTGSLLIHSNAFCELVQPLGLPLMTWSGRIGQIQQMVEKLAIGGDA